MNSSLFSSRENARGAPFCGVRYHPEQFTAEASFPQMRGRPVVGTLGKASLFNHEFCIRKRATGRYLLKRSRPRRTRLSVRCSSQRLFCRTSQASQLEPAIVVVVEKGDAAPFCLDNVLLVIDSAPHIGSGQAGLSCDVDVGDRNAISPCGRSCPEKQTVLPLVKGTSERFKQRDSENCF